MFGIPIFKRNRGTGAGTSRGRLHRSMMGGRRMGGSRVWNFIKKAHRFIKDNKLVSRGANMLSKVLPPKYRQIAQGIGTGATALGYGRRRRRGYGLRLAGM